MNPRHQKRMSSAWRPECRRKVFLLTKTRLNPTLSARPAVSRRSRHIWMGLGAQSRTKKIEKNENAPVCCCSVFCQHSCLLCPEDWSGLSWLWRLDHWGGCNGNGLDQVVKDHGCAFHFSCFQVVFIFPSWLALTCT